MPFFPGRITVYAVGILLLLSACARPPLTELETARRQLAIARDVGAANLVPEAYGEAEAVFSEGEQLVASGDYDQALQVLNLAEARARLATRMARENQTDRQLDRLRQQRLAEELKRQQLEEVSIPLPPPIPETPPAEPAPLPLPPASAPPHPEPVSSYQVTGGETLWTIAARREVYGDALLWPLLYKANRDQIKDPRQIYQGQVLTVPRKQSESDLAEARATARASEIFPVPPPAGNGNK